MRNPDRDKDIEAICWLASRGWGLIAPKKNKVMTREEAIEVYNGLINVKIREAFEFFVPELHESEDERIRKALIEGVRQIRCKNGITQEQMIAYLEKQREQTKEKVEPITDGLSTEFQKQVSYLIASSINKEHEYSEGYVKWVSQSLLGHAKFAMSQQEKQKEQKPADLPPGFYLIDPDGKKYYSKEFRLGNMKMKIVEDEQKKQKPEGVYVDCTEHPDWYGMPQKPTAKVNSEPVPTENYSVDAPLAEWSEEDIEMYAKVLFCFQSLTFPTDEERHKMMSWLKSLRPQSKDEIYKEKDEAFKLGKHQLAIRFMNYLDENRPEGKMGLSNAECEDIDKAFKENDWAKILRYAEKYGK